MDKKFPGFSRAPYAYGRDALFLAQRLRKDYWRNHQERSDLLAYKENLVKNQRRAEYTNEVRRIEGFLQSNLTHQARKNYLRPRQQALLSQLGVSGLPD